MSLATPIKLKSLQRALYSKAKREPNARFHFLYDKVWRADVLVHAYRCNRSNGGAPGIDGQTFAAIEAYGVRRWLVELQEELRNETYKPKPVRRVMIPKPGGVGERPLGIPTIRDRVVQMAVKLVTEPMSPLLANLYMHRFIKAFRKFGLEEKHGAVLVNYADDFVVLCRRNAPEALTKIRSWFAAIGLEINESKTSVRHARRESFDFLGYTFKMQRSFKNGQLYPGASPSVKAVKRLKESIRSQLHCANMKPIEMVVKRLNRTLRGWANYFRCGTVMLVRHKLDRFIYDRVRYFLARRAKLPTRGAYRYSRPYVFEALGVVSLNSLPRIPA